MEKISVGILTISDRCYQNKMVDESGPNLVRLIDNGSIENGNVVETDLVPDEITEIEKVLKYWCDEKKLNVILTTGGTGLGPRDVTPEATTSLLEKTVPGISQLIFKHTSKITSYAALSRCLSGVRKKSLVVNFPGSKKAAQECLEAIGSIIPHAVNLICNSNTEKIENLHSNCQNVCHSKVAPTNNAEKLIYPLITVSEAQTIILNKIYLIKREICVPLNKALGCVLSQEVVATESQPPYDVSLKDGFAVVSSDDTVNRKIIGTCKMGSLNSNIKIIRGVCAQISTGATLPFGADAVIPLEDVKMSGPLSDFKEITITNVKMTGLHNTNHNQNKSNEFGSKYPSGNVKMTGFEPYNSFSFYNTNHDQNKSNELVSKYPSGNEVRRKGSDVSVGSLLLDYGTYLDSSALGLLASVGITSVRIFAKPKVAIFSTGDELINPEDTLTESKVRDSNRITLLSLLEEEGFPASDCGIVHDEPDAIFSSLVKAFGAADVVVTSGGMSMGDRDYMKEIIKTDFDSEIHFGRVFMMPGKPTACATVKFKGKTKLWFGMPGNPASAFVASHLFLLPALKKISGYKNVFPPSVTATLQFDIPQKGRPQYHRAILSYVNGRYQATTTGSQMSSRIGSCVNANCFLVIPEGGKIVAKDDEVEAILIGKNHIVSNEIKKKNVK